MFALIYLSLSFLLGDLICRRFYSFASLPHRLACALLTGLLISTWTTYGGAFLFAKSSQPLLWGNLLFFAIAVGVILRLNRQTPREYLRETVSQADVKNDKWDWITLGVFALFACWQMFSTFNMTAGKVQIANHQWSDFGSTVSIMQSFALGNNFPTEYPHFTGERMRYHFLYYFQAGNLEYLGLNPALANNLLSIVTLLAMLALVMTLGRILFRSEIVGRIGAGLFFFHGSLSFIPFFIAQGSIGNALSTAYGMRDFLPSIFPYRGELWGIWSQVVFLNQRHFAGSIGIFLLVVVFLSMRYRTALSVEEPENLNADDADSPPATFWRETLEKAAPFIFSGMLLGLLPMWNSAVFVAAGAVLGLFFLLFPLRKEMLALAATTALIALPQVIFLKTGNLRPAGYSLLHWGYTVENATFANVVQYLGFTFGFKWLLIVVALVLATRFERRVFIAFSGLIALAFCFQFSDEVLAHHKFLNVWLVVANLFVAFGLWRLWNANLFKNALIGKIAAGVLTTLIVIGGIIDLFPIRNGYWMEMPFTDDALVNWVREQTEPQAIFLSHRFVNHGILLAGRRVFYGHPYYAWSAGYPTAERDVVYKKMFETQNPREVFDLLRENRISYVAIDDQVRKEGFVKNVNEAVFQKYFEIVFEDTDSKYNALKIYKVPAVLGNVPLTVNAANVDESVPPVNAFTGGQGKGRGQFDKPRGAAIDAAGNLYVADTGNARIQKFAPDGAFLAVFGKPGTGEGQLREPNGIAVDAAGDVYVADALNHRLLKYKADGTFIKQWLGPAEMNFYGPRDLAIAPNGQIYILDQGRTRVVKFDPKSEKFAEWGQVGTEAGQFKDPTGIAVGSNFVFVTDAGNNRIQVFDAEGKFIRQWNVPEWDKYLWHYPDAAFDAQTKRLYVTSGWTNEVLVFDAEGEHLDSLKTEDSAKLDNPSSVALIESKSGKRLAVLNTGGANVSKLNIANK